MHSRDWDGDHRAKEGQRYLTKRLHVKEQAMIGDAPDAVLARVMDTLQRPRYDGRC